MIQFHITNDNKWVKIIRQGEIQVVFFPRSSVAYIGSGILTIVRNSVHADSELSLKISDIDAQNSNPPFSKDTSQSLKAGIANFFEVGVIDESDSSGGGGGGADGTVDDIPIQDLSKFKDVMIGFFGNNALDTYRTLLDDGKIQDVGGII